MKHYLVLTQPSLEYADALNRSVWAIARPDAVRQPEDTQLYTSVHVHPATGDVALYVPDDTRSVHVDADIGALLTLIGMAVTADELAALTETIESARGGNLSLKTLIEDTPSLAANLITQSTAESDGWFANEII